MAIQRRLSGVRHLALGTIFFLPFVFLLPFRGADVSSRLRDISFCFWTRDFSFCYDRPYPRRGSRTKAPFRMPATIANSIKATFALLVSVDNAMIA